MPRTCTVCAHRERTEIDRALLAGEPFRNVAKRHGTSPAALFRHKWEHIPSRLAKAKQAAEDLQANSLFERVKELAAEAKAILRDARASNNHSIALQAIARAEKLLELEGRLLGELNEGAKVAVGIQVRAPEPHYLERFHELAQMTDEELAARAEQIAVKLEAARRAGGDSGGKPNGQW